MEPRRPLLHLKKLHAAVDALVRQTDPSSLAGAWADRDFVIFNATTTFAHAIAGELGAPSTMVVMTPAVATDAFAHPVLAPGLALGRPGNLATWLAAERLQRQTFREPLRPSARRAWGLPPLLLDPRRRGITWPPFALLHAYSPEVVARPPDWGAHVSVTGWLLPQRSPELLPEDVERFLDDGDAPLYIGFGSMPVFEPERVARMLVAALRRTGQRAIVCGADLARTSTLKGADAVLAAAELPHERLLDRVRAVVHHGGSGTVGAGLRAGRPTFVVPFLFDQFFWGDRVRRLGVGPAPLPFRRLTEHRLADGLAALASGRYDAAARRLGERIRAEDPTARAVEAIERRAGLAA
jgi:UDP:flavonoid glycosyltransferase YjiC (YdhE family)